MISINEDITLKVRMMTNEVIIIKINKLKTILEIKQEIRRIKNISVVNQKLIFQGKVLKDSDKITTYKLEDNDVINLIISQPNNNNNINSSRENRSREVPNLIQYLTMLSNLTNRLINPFLNNNNNNNRNTFSFQQNNRNNNYNSNDDINISDSFIHLLKPSNFNIYNSMENIIQNINNIETLISSKNKITSKTLFSPNNTHSNNHINFQIGQWVDIYDNFSQWSEAQLIQIDSNTNKGLFHFIGSSDINNEWIYLNSPRISLYRVHTIQSPFSKYFSPFPNKIDANNNLSISGIDFTMIISKIKNLMKFCDELKDSLNIVYNFKNFDKFFYLNLMQLYPIMDRIGRIFLDYSMFLMNYCFKYFNENFENFKDYVDNIQLNNNFEITDNNLLKEKVFQFENFTKVGVMRNNGEIAQYYRMINLNNDNNSNNLNNNNNNNNEFRINNFGGANFQAQLRSISNPSNNRNNNIINNNENYNNNSRINIRIINNRNVNNNNNNRLSIDYLKSFSIAPSNYIKFNSNKTKIIKVNKFSIFHYNSFKPRTFETFTQTFPKYIDNKICKIENLNIENKKNKLINSINNFNKTKNSFNSSIINNKPIIKTSKIIINADKSNKNNNNNKNITLKLRTNKINININNNKKHKNINKK